MTELWLIRHGRTDWNDLSLLQGQTDIPLNATGEEQARQLTEMLEGECFDAVYASDLQRAIATARAVADPRGLPVVTDSRLRERNFGVLEGQDFRTVDQTHPQVSAARKADPVHYVIPEGESLEQVADRMIQAVGEVVTAHPDGRVVVVSHGAALAALMCVMDGYPLENVTKVRIENAVPMVKSWNGLTISAR